MPVYTVDIACNSPDHDYAALHDALRRSKAHHFMRSRWLLDVREDLDTLTTALLRACAPGDSLFVTELAPETRWSGSGLDKDAKAWLLARMTKVPVSFADLPMPAGTSLN